ncbi:MAG: dockerin type I domain-containing protein [Candidatus Peregrinibacteria bacterium]
MDHALSGKMFRGAILILVVCALAAAGAFFAINRGSFHAAPPVQEPNDIPIPFTQNPETILSAYLTPEQIAQNGKTIYDVSFPLATDLSRELATQGIHNVVTPDTADVSDGVKLNFALTENKIFYGYKYSDVIATDEFQAQFQAQRLLNTTGDAVPFITLFPRQFFASPAAEANPQTRAILDSYRGRGVDFLPLSDITLEKNARYVIVTGDDTGVIFTIRGIRQNPWFNIHEPMDVNGNGIVEKSDWQAVRDFINLHGTSTPVVSGTVPSPLYPDVDGNGRVEPIDVAIIAAYIGGECGKDGVQPGLGEVCDNGVTNDDCAPAYGGTCSYCKSDCSGMVTKQGGFCGDHTVQAPPEECDPLVPNSSCRSNCMKFPNPFIQ